MSIGFFWHAATCGNCQNRDWAGWALPMTIEGQPFHVALYCQEIFKFAETFLDRTQIGVVRVAPRSLDALGQGGQTPLSIEDGNRRILDQSFFMRGFATVKEMQESSGVQYSVSSGQTLRNDDLALVQRLDPGTLQFFQVWRSSWPRFPQCVGYCRRWWLVLRVDLQTRTGGTGPLRHP